MLECIIHEANIAMFISPWTHILFLISWENVSLFLLEDKQNVMFGGVVQYELYLHFECVFYIFI